jgi:hypothetical protein
MRQLAFVFIALALAGCAAQLIGPYSGSLSPEDVRQIQTLVDARSDIHYKTIIYIHATRPACVYVEAADSPLGSIIRSTFTACKRAGKWIINERSIENYDEIIVTS